MPNVEAPTVTDSSTLPYAPGDDWATYDPLVFGQSFPAILPGLVKVRANPDQIVWELLNCLFKDRALTFGLREYESIAEVVTNFYDGAEERRREDIFSKILAKELPADAELRLTAYIAHHNLENEYAADDFAADLRALPYQKFLESEYWSVIRAVAVSRCHGKCQLCSSRGLLHTHHKTYENRGREYAHMDDLICLCRACHQKFHDKLPKEPSRANV